MTVEETHLAVVQKVVTEGRHGPYAVASTDEIVSITFSLRPPVWEEDDVPEPGTVVILTRVRKKRAGWRAMSGRFMKPSDEQPATKQQKGATRK